MILVLGKCRYRALRTSQTSILVSSEIKGEPISIYKVSYRENNNCGLHTFMHTHVPINSKGAPNTYTLTCTHMQKIKIKFLEKVNPKVSKNISTHIQHGYKIIYHNIIKPAVFLHTCKEQSKNKIKKFIYNSSPKIVKCLGITLI